MRIEVQPTAHSRPSSGSDESNSSDLHLHSMPGRYEVVVGFGGRHA